jgi:uncharacterized RDD family membrane protein YckC
MKKCPHCGKEYPDDATVCAIDQTSFDDPYNSPSDGPDYSKQDRSPYAGFAIRLLARLIDMTFGFFVAYVSSFLAILTIVMLGSAGVISPGWQYRLHAFSMIAILLFMAGESVYHIFCEGIHGATVGKLCCGLRVISQDGQPSTFKGAIIRTLAYLLECQFFGLPAYDSMRRSPLNQRYGDKWGKTAVVKIKETDLGSQRTPTIFILGLATGVGCWYLLVLMGFILKVTSNYPPP